MEVLQASESLKWKDRVIKAVKDGAIFIYPTDTIYGIGCDATNDEAVKKIREIKERPTNPFSVIVPYLEWIPENCEVDEKYLDKLPGPFTFICKQKTKLVSEHVNPGKDSLGLRLPDSWFTGFIFDIGVPIVTTSVNKAGEKYMTSLDDLDKNIKDKVDFCIYEGPKEGKPSTLIDFTKKPVEIRER